MRFSSGGGFILLEVMPALLLLGAAVAVGGGILWSSGSLREREAIRQSAQELFPLVWAKWEGSGGRAAVAVLRDGEPPVILDFPDPGWLPGFPERESGQTSLWRRSYRGIAGDSGFWNVEVRTAKSGEWQWYLAVMEFPAEAPGGQD